MLNLAFKQSIILNEVAVEIGLYGRLKRLDSPYFTATYWGDRVDGRLRLVRLFGGSGDGAAAQDDVAAVDYNGLAGGDGSLRLVKG